MPSLASIIKDSIFNVNGNTKNTAVKNSKSVSHFFYGFIPAIQQKVTTRSTMFVTSSISVQLFEHQFGWNTTASAFIGSATSGYITGFIASPWEWQKVLVSQQVRSPSTGMGMVSLFSEAKKHHRIFRGILVCCVGRRMRAAGVKNAIFDSTFFGIKHVLEDYSAAAFGCINSRHSFLVSSGFACSRGRLYSGCCSQTNVCTWTRIADSIIWNNETHISYHAKEGEEDISRIWCQEC